MIFELSVSLPCHHTGVARRVPQPQEEIAVGGTRRSSHSPLRRGTGTQHGLPRPNWTQWGCWCSSVVAQVEL